MYKQNNMDIPFCYFNNDVTKLRKEKLEPKIRNSQLVLCTMIQPSFTVLLTVWVCLANSVGASEH
jgi:hypothetical protein